MHQAALNCDKLSCAACHLPLNDLDDVHVLVRRQPGASAFVSVDRMAKCPENDANIRREAIYIVDSATNLFMAYLLMYV